jgi:hypothetical protein
VGFLRSLLFWSSWGGWGGAGYARRRTAVVDDGPVVEERRVY